MGLYLLLSLLNMGTKGGTQEVENGTLPPIEMIYGARKFFLGSDKTLFSRREIFSCNLIFFIARKKKVARNKIFAARKKNCFVTITRKNSCHQKTLMSGKTSPSGRENQTCYPTYAKAYKNSGAEKIAQ